MQATIDSFALKPFIRAIQCLSKYGDDLLIHATPSNMSFSATSASMSAYCRFTYDLQFFVRYHLGPPGKGKGKERAHDHIGNVSTVTGQLLAKSLLSILKHRTVEKSVDRCEFIISDGPLATSDDGEDDDDEDRDSLESTLVIRLHCQHGVIKTHRLLLHNPSSLMAPNPPNADEASRLTVSARIIRDIVDHLPSARAGVGGGPGKGGGKNDPQLAWIFGDNEVTVKSLEMGADAKGKAQLASEIAISVDEFELYEILTSPLTISFHLREFMATITYTEALSLSLAMKFTTATAPLFIDVDGGDGYEVLFVISTSSGGASLSNGAASRQRVNGGGQADPRTPVAGRKRGHDDGDVDISNESVAGPISAPAGREGSTRPTPARIHPQRAVQRTDPATHARIMAATSRASMPPPPTFPQAISQPWQAPQLSHGASTAPPLSMGPPPDPLPPSTHVSDSEDLGYFNPLTIVMPAREPLFLPSSQADDERFGAAPPLSQSEVEGARELVGMTDAELWAVLEDTGPDDEESVPSSQRNERVLASVATFPAQDDEESLPGTSEEEFDELMYDGSEVEVLVPTQARPRAGGREGKGFRPLFED